MKKILVMMSTYNGEKYLKEQIDSILNQNHVDVYLIIRDDGSTDSTKKIISDYLMNPKVSYYFGENLGYAKSFWDLLLKAHGFDYYAFSDQDDFWKEEKLYNAILLLEQSEGNVSLYGSGLELVDENLKHIDYIKFEGIKVTLGSALSRQRLAGCTMVFNNSLLELCKMYELDKIQNVNFGHDGLVYLTCLGVNGTVIYNPVCDIKFRRHSTTLTSGGRGLKNRIKNELLLFTSKSGNKQHQVEIIYKNLSEHLSEQAIELFDEVISYRNSLVNTIKLSINRELRCGIVSVDLIIKMAILFRRF